MIVYCQECDEGFEGNHRHKYCESCKANCKFCDKDLTLSNSYGNTCNSCTSKRSNYCLSDEEMFDIKDRKTCECCGNGFKNHRDKSQDHCHTTGNNRGIICHRCNWAVGMFETTEQNNIIKYITKYRK